MRYTADVIEASPERRFRAGHFTTVRARRRFVVAIISERRCAMRAIVNT